MGEAPRTDFNRVNLPPIERVLTFHLDNRYLNLSTTSSQALCRDILPPILTPRYRNWLSVIEHPIERHNVAFGIVFRDSASYLRYVFGNPYNAIFPTHAEITVVHYSCSLALNRGWFIATMEYDSQLVISVSSSETPLPCSLAAFVDNIRL
nr:hypothetical protein [Tanacetum cinerariifolium]